jgi:CRISPR-associated exonuclease Cas4
MTEAAPVLLPIVEPWPVLRVSDLRQWTYCPRVAFFTLVCPVPKVSSFKMVVGLQKEQRLARLQRRRTLRAFGLSGGTVEADVSLYSPRLGLAGRLDLLIRRGPQRFPVEVKFTHGPSRLNHHLQLTGYALLLEDLFGLPVPCGYVVRLPDDEAERIEIDNPLREAAAALVAALRDMIRTERFPPASPLLARCVDCEYRNFCGDVL